MRKKGTKASCLHKLTVSGKVPRQTQIQAIGSRHEFRGLCESMSCKLALNLWSSILAMQVLFQVGATIPGLLIRF